MAIQIQDLFILTVMRGEPAVHPELTDTACFVGVGASRQGKMPGCTGDDLAVMALKEALLDAGTTISRVDGLVVNTSYGGGGSLREVGHRLGIAPKVAFTAGYQGEAIQIAMMAIATGMASCVALMYGTNQKTNRNRFSSASFHVGGNFEKVYGLANPGSTAAFNFRRRMFDFGATEEQLGAVAVAQSRAAALNPRAVFRERLSIEDYLATPYVIAPLRLVDFSMVSDGGFASLLVDAKIADEFRGPAVSIHSLGYQSSFLELDHPDAMYHPSQKPNSERLWASSSYTQDDVDCMYVQDAFTPNVLSALENYGFCEFGTAHEWIQGGRIELDGELPVNVNGGQNRMTYMRGWHNTFDAVKQLRGEAEGEGRQVDGCDVVLCTMSGGHWQETSSMLLHRKGV